MALEVQVDALPAGKLLLLGLFESWILMTFPPNPSPSWRLKYRSMPLLQAESWFQVLSAKP